MRILNDYYMVTVDQRYETTINNEGIITLSTAWINEETVERFAYKRCYGQIEGCPLQFSDTVVNIKDIGTPVPKKYISGEYIEKRVKMGYKGYSNANYACTTFDDFDTVTLADIGKNVDIRRYDKCYFPPQVTEPAQEIGRHHGKILYAIRVDDIICTVRDGEILMQGGWCLVEPEMETWEEITTKAGIIMKPFPEAKTLRGKMRHMQYREDLKEGDRVLFHKGADWRLKVEGKEYYAILDEDILAKFAA